MTETTLHKLPRMRGIKQAIDELKQLDSNTALTEHALRRLILSGDVPSVRCGTKYLINMDVLIDYLYKGSCGDRINPMVGYDSIRVIKEKGDYYDKCNKTKLL